MKLKKYIPLSGSELIAVMAIFLVSAGLIGGSRLSRLADSSSISAQKPIDIYVPEKLSLKKLSNILADSGVVESRDELLWAGRLLGWNSFQPGHYRIDEGHSYNSFLSKMARGIQDPVKVTLVPGLSTPRLVHTLSEKLKFDSLDFSGAITDSTFLNEAGIRPEQLLGRMLPNTYSFYWTSSPQTVIERILKEFHNVAYEPNEDRFREIDKTVDDIVTLASIIEWEANSKEEMSRISGLYWNRLNKGMLLQADPTVNFVVKERRRLLYEDYKIDHSYNTYMYEGLPPGPITNPSLNSIKAALYPEEHNFLYMVASPEGGHQFSKTFSEHKRKSAKWREWIREQYRIKRQREREGGANN